MDTMTTGILLMFGIMIFAAIFSAADREKEVAAKFISGVLLVLSMITYLLLLSILNDKIEKGTYGTINKLNSGSYAICAYYEENDNLYLLISEKEKESPSYKKISKKIVEIHGQSETNKFVVTASEGIKKYDIYLVGEAKKSPSPKKTGP
jgi:hypothetical protein